jgi:hypothetical protein
MVTLMKKILTKKEIHQNQTEFNRVMYSKQIALIKEEWCIYPVNLDIKYCNSFEQIDSFPRSGQKDDFFIGVIPWAKRNVDVIIFTKHNFSGEIILDTTIENLTREQLAKLGLLPNANRTICSSCNEFSSHIYYDSKCEDCL